MNFFFEVQSKCSVESMTENISLQITFIKILPDQSEQNAPPAGCSCFLVFIFNKFITCHVIDGGHYSFPNAIMK